MKRATKGGGQGSLVDTLEVLVADRGREFAFCRDVLHCGVCDWRYHIEPQGVGTLLMESYEVKEPDWAITNWFNGLVLGVEDRDEDLVEGPQTTLERVKQAAEREHEASSSSARLSEPARSQPCASLIL